MPSPNPLTPKQLRFVEEYLIDRNGKQAAIRAGYSANTAKSQAWRLLTNVNVAAEIARRSERISKKLAVTADNVIEELRRIAFTDRRGLFAWGAGGVVPRESSELTDEEAALVEEVSQTVTEGGGTIRIKTGSKVEALKLLAQHLGILDKGEVGIPVNVEIVKQIVRIKHAPAVREIEVGA